MQRTRGPVLRGLEVDGARLFHLRTSKGLSQRTVAARANITEVWYRRIERRGQQPSRSVAEDIARALGCDLTDFCGMEPAADAA
jgi:transcriptional regulator with XRE-family HTH domain